MRALTIEWRYYVKVGQTGVRCSATGKTVAEVVSDLREEFEPQLAILCGFRGLQKRIERWLSRTK